MSKSINIGKFFGILLFLLFVFANQIVYAQTQEGVIESVAVLNPIEAGEKLTEETSGFLRGFLSGIKNVFRAVGNFLINVVGIRIADGLRPIAEFFIWLFESLIKLIRWGLSFL